ncbi:MAG TPA: oligosaccharide flippase family protein [Chloroflexi bacterium]|nr:oligosaccharide flippase family protein [Chloroflexota bacterium]
MQNAFPVLLEQVQGIDSNRMRIWVDATPASLPIVAAGVRAAILRAPEIAAPEMLATEAVRALQAYWQILCLAAPETHQVCIAIDPVAWSVTIEVDDLWHWTQTYAVAAPEAEEQHSEDDSLGIGLFLVRRIMDEVEYFPQPGGNRWRLLKRLGDALPASQSGDPVTVVKLDLPASYRYLSVLGECINAMLGGDSEAANALQLAAHETCTNIIDHAYAGRNGRIEATLTLDRPRRTFLVETRDHGERTFDLTLIPDRFDPTAPVMRSPLLTGSVLLFVSATLVNAGNYLFNLLMGRWFGPAGFADISLVITLFLVMSFITAGLQTPAARFGALYAADHDWQGLADLRRWAKRRAAWIAGGLMALLILGSGLWTQFFGAASNWMFVIFGMFVPFYVLQGVDRGLLQGRTRFGWLAVTYQVEMWARLFLSLGLALLGLGVNGVVLGIGLSFVAAWFVAQQVARDLPPAQKLADAVSKEIILFTGPVLVAQLGQILINNSDILIVRRYFVAEEAGAYAALALIGRMVFFATWSIVTAMFPIVAQRFRRGEAHRPLFYLSLGIVLGGSLLIVMVTALFPTQIVQLLFGDAYLAIAPLLWVYAVATMFYALANVVINYRLSIGSTGGTYLAIAAGVTQVAALWLWHATLAQVVWIQVGLMATLFVLLMGWDWINHLKGAQSAPAPLAEGAAG